MAGDCSPKPLVLVVEDEPLLRMMAVDIIEHAGLAFIEAESGDEAIPILESRDDIRIVLTDVEMPGSTDGMMLAAMIRDRWPPIEIIITSGQVHPAQDTLPTRGAFLSKPYRPAELAAMLVRMTG